MIIGPSQDGLVFNMKKIITILLLFLFSVISCSVDNASGDVMNIAISQDVDSLDVMKSTSRVLRDILMGSVYEKLFVLDDGEIKCELASSYHISEGGHRLEIPIRKGVMMHDGSLLDSHDVCVSLNWYIECYEAASEMFGPSRFEETDDGVEITSDNKLYLFPYLIASSPQSAAIAKAYSLEENEYGLVTEIVGSGPYRLFSFITGSAITLERFDDYSAYG